MPTTALIPAKLPIDPATKSANRKCLLTLSQPGETFAFGGKTYPEGTSITFGPKGPIIQPPPKVPSSTQPTATAAAPASVTPTGTNNPAFSPAVRALMAAAGQGTSYGPPASADPMTTAHGPSASADPMTVAYGPPGSAAPMDKPFGPPDSAAPPTTAAQTGVNARKAVGNALGNAATATGNALDKASATVGNAVGGTVDAVHSFVTGSPESATGSTSSYAPSTGEPADMYASKPPTVPSADQLAGQVRGALGSLSLGMFSPPMPPGQTGQVASAKPAPTPTIQPKPAPATASTTTSAATPSGAPTPTVGNAVYQPKTQPVGNAVYQPTEQPTGNAQYKANLDAPGNAVYNPDANAQGNATYHPIDRPTGNAVYQPTTQPVGNAQYDASKNAQGNAVYKPNLTVPDFSGTNNPGFSSAVRTLMAAAGQGSSSTPSAADTLSKAPGYGPSAGTYGAAPASTPASNSPSISGFGDNNTARTTPATSTPSTVEANNPGVEAWRQSQDEAAKKQAQSEAETSARVKTFGDASVADGKALAQQAAPIVPTYSFPDDDEQKKKQNGGTAVA